MSFATLGPWCFQRTREDTWEERASPTLSIGFKQEKPNHRAAFGSQEVLREHPCTVALLCGVGRHVGGTGCLRHLWTSLAWFGSSCSNSSPSR